MEIQQMIKHLLAGQAKADADREQMLAEMNPNMKSNHGKAEANRKADQDLLARLEAKIETNRETDREERKAQRKYYQENLKKMTEEMLRANQDKMDTWLTGKQDGRKERTACYEATRADTEKTEPDPRMMQSIGEHQEVPKEEATVMLVGGLRKQCRDWNLAVGCCQKPKRRIQASHESWKRLTVDGRGVSRCTRMA
jgi:hypothetical protein